MTRRHTCASTVLLSLLFAAAAPAQPVYNDGHGREWRQLPTTTNLSWSQVAQVCPTDGQTPCAGSIGSNSLDGWTWATREQVRELFGYFDSRILTQDTLQGPEYLVSALTFLGGGYITPTSAFYTTTGGYLYAAGWVADQNEDGTAAIASASAQYPVFDAHWSVAGANVPTFTSQFVGVWLFRDIPGFGCDVDLNDSGSPDVPDIFAFLSLWFASDPAADFDGNGAIAVPDIFAFLSAWFAGC